MQKPAYAGLRRLQLFLARRSRLSPAFAGSFRGAQRTGQSRLLPWPKEPAFGQKKPAFGRKGAGFWPKEAGSFSVGRHGKEPAHAGSAGSFFGPEKSRLTRPKPAPCSGRLWPALTKAGSFLPWRPTVWSPAESTSPHGRQAAARLLNDVVFGHLFRAAGRKRGKHSYGAQREERSRRKPAFTVFSG